MSSADAAVKLDAYVGNQPHYINHLVHTWSALPDDIRGEFYVRRNSNAYTRAVALGLTVNVQPPKFTADDIVLVAGYDDYRTTKPAQVIFWNHGAGQTYGRSAQRSVSHSGGKNRDRAIAFICPGPRDAELNVKYYPKAICVPVGVPYLDQFAQRRSPDGSIAISFHAEVNLCPETRPAWSHYAKAIEALVATGKYNIIGHAHPRAKKVPAWWRKIGVEFVQDWWDVLERASVYVIDNSSTGYEAAALGIPTVWMNAPWYRRDVEHGLRFWSHVPGYQVSYPGQLDLTIKHALLGGSITIERKRLEAVEHVYGNLIDGHATFRAVEALTNILISS